MSKTVLGRGLNSLMAGNRPGPEDPASPGVQLLLRGADGEELVAPIELARRDDARGFPSWALGVTVISDAVLALVGLWIVWAHAGVGRYVAAGALVCVGAAQLVVAVSLRGQRAVQELQSLNPLADEKPRLRVQFLDEQPRRRS